MVPGIQQLTHTHTYRSRTPRMPGHIDRLLALASHLPEGDRLLIEEVYARGRSVTELALLADEEPRKLRRRLGSILKRMEDRKFHFLATRGDLLPRPVRATARRAVLEGKSLRQTAQLTGLSLHRVRQHLRTVETLASL